MTITHNKVYLFLIAATLGGRWVDERAEVDKLVNYCNLLTLHFEGWWHVRPAAWRCQMQNVMIAPSQPKHPLLLENLGHHLIYGFLGLPWAHIPNGISISSAVFAELAVLTNAHTDHATTVAIGYILRYVQRCSLINAAKITCNSGAHSHSSVKNRYHLQEVKENATHKVLSGRTAKTKSPICKIGQVALHVLVITILTLVNRTALFLHVQETRLIVLGLTEH